MNCQMIRVISSPSGSTTGLVTLILDMWFRAPAVGVQRLLDIKILQVRRPSQSRSPLPQPCAVEASHDVSSTAWNHVVPSNLRAFDSLARDSSLRLGGSASVGNQPTSRDSSSFTRATPPT